MPPGAAFCPVFSGAFTVRFVTVSVVMGDGTDLNVTAAIGNRGATLVSAARRGLFVEVSEGASTNTYLKGGAARSRTGPACRLVSLLRASRPPGFPPF